MKSAVRILNAPISQIIKPDFKLVKIQEDTPLGTSLEILAKANVFSAPLYNETGTVGVLDLEDIVAHFVQLGDQPDDGEAEPSGNRERSGSLSGTPRGWLASEAVRKAWMDAMLNTPAKAVMNCCQRNSFVTVKKSATCKEVCDQILTEAVHRVYAVDDEGNIVAVISQSTILRYLYEHSGAWRAESIAEDKLKIHNIVRTALVTAREDETAILAFTRMIQNNVSALPILDYTGEMQGTLSIKDIKGVLSDLNRLTVSVGEFMKGVRNDSVVDEMAVNIYVTPEDTIWKALVGLQQANIHRLWIVMSTAKPALPIGVLSLYDMLQLLLKLIW
eukprot:CAMPEP_0177632416 /NCGR_PEP_ID=MMETSP0447-20121125/2279_1 /TAXON_ID=0 /ORGANISM="Stygamoeba regulata, Strain BSH-02190019" /LENGTH=331 /DNA_ID=CAMNT_0019133981 /DNA_START=132 /DNA_END=1124 /DNA_ORIENTATION=-